MRKILILGLLIGLASCQEDDSKATTMDRQSLHEYSLAKCSDGSPAAYYIEKVTIDRSWYYAEGVARRDDITFLRVALRPANLCTVLIKLTSLSSRINPMLETRSWFSSKTPWTPWISQSIHAHQWTNALTYVKACPNRARPQMMPLKSSGTEFGQRKRETTRLPIISRYLMLFNDFSKIFHIRTFFIDPGFLPWTFAS